MLDIFEQIKEMEETKIKIKNFCKNIIEIYNKYAENKIDIEGKFQSVKISRKDEKFIRVQYNFVQDFGSYERNDPNDYGNRTWVENLKTVEKTIYFPESVFLGLTDPQRYSNEYVEEELKIFAEQENKKVANTKLLEDFKSFTLNSNYGVLPEEQFHTMLMAFLTDVRNCFNSYQWFANKYLKTEKYSHQVESTVKNILKNYRWPLPMHSLVKLERRVQF